MAKKKTQNETPGPETRRRRKPQEKVPVAEEGAAFTAARSAELYKLAEELRAILDAAVDAIITINHRGIIVRINAAAERLFGYSESEMLGENVRMLMPSPDREQHDGHLRRYSVCHSPDIGWSISDEWRCEL